jgi:hypothetical protein
MFAGCGQNDTRLPTEPVETIDLGVMPTITPPSEDDPAAQGWETEAFTDRALQQLTLLAKLLASNDTISEDITKSFITDQFECTSLKLANENQVYASKNLTVSRRTADKAPANQFQGALGLAKALQELRFPIEHAGHRKVKFKLYRIDEQEDHVTTQQYLSISGKTDNQTIEQHASWTCVWAKSDNSELPKLKRIGVDHIENVKKTGRWFTDCTFSIVSKNRAFWGQLIHSAQYWWPRIQTTYEFDMDGHIGGAIGDVNGDGLEDLYVCQPYGLPNLLFKHNPDGTVTDISAKAGVDWMERSTSALLIDFDNDGDQDLITYASPQIVFMANDGQGNFELKTSLQPVIGAYSMAAADYDLDGDLDIYVCIRLDPSLTGSNQISSPNPYHDANNGAPNRLIRNDGNWQLTDVTREVGLDQNNRRWSFAATWEDYDNDGDMDLYVANDYGRNNLYRNDAGQFTDVAATSGTEDVASGMSVSFGDYNRDGLMDLYVSNMFSAAGNRTTFQKQYQPNTPQDVREMVQRMARGNSLFTGQTDGRFADISIDAGVTMGRWAWGSKFIDINNDGWEDLVVTNGNMTGDQDTKDL